MMATRREALSAGERWYFTGKPCRNRHVDLRGVQLGCVACYKARLRRVQEEHRKTYALNPLCGWVEDLYDSYEPPTPGELLEMVNRKEANG